MEIKNTQDVQNLLRMYIASGAVGTALELRLFHQLAEQPLTTNDISHKFDIPYDRCKSWLALLCELNLLDYKEKKYSPSFLTEKAILEAYSSETWAFLAQEIRERYPVIINLPVNISHPNSVWEAQKMVPQDYITQMKNDTKRAERFTRMLYELHQTLGHKIAERLDLTDIKQLMDIGGGSGVISLALLERYPNLKVVVVDIENVCMIGRQITNETKVANRITYHAGDFVQDNLPTGFDMIIECDVGVYSEVLFRKLWISLKEGGKFVIVTNTNEQGAWLTYQNSKPSLFWYLSVFSESLGVPKFKLTSIDDIKTQLRNVGFHNVSEQVQEDGIVFIQAIK